MDSILHNQSNAEYHQNPALGSTTIKEWSLKSPAHAMYGERTINSYIAAEGTAAHFVFEGKPEKVLCGGETRRGSAWTELEKQAPNIGGVALPVKAYNHAMAAGNAARNHCITHNISFDEVTYCIVIHILLDTPRVICLWILLWLPIIPLVKVISS